jgi:hypothetical protein
MSRRRSKGRGGVKLLLWRTPRWVAVAICAALYLASVVCAVVALRGPKKSYLLLSTALALASIAGTCHSAIIHADHTKD